MEGDDLPEPPPVIRKYIPFTEKRFAASSEDMVGFFE
jgi:hypothetical protein